MTEPRIGNYSSCCRLCLTDKYNYMDNIYTGYSDCTDLLNKILLLIGVQITPNDKLSTMLCEKCYSLINTWAGFKKKCLSNQETLKKWRDNCTENAANIHIKEEPIDTDEVPNEIISVNGDDEQIAVKSEPVDGEAEDVESESDLKPEEEYYDLPPPLTPHPPEDPETPEASSAHIETELSSSSLGKRITPKHCYVCQRTFSNPSNRKKHERVMHGLHGGKVKSVSSTELLVNQAVLDDASSTENHSNTSSPLIVYENGNQSKNEKDQDKINFAAGLCLQSKSVGPKQSQLTKIEHLYLEKCKVMISMFSTNTCACHNQLYVSMKQMLGHLRQLYPCFPPYTCYNCLLTFDGRSSKMRHVTRCRRLKLESLIRLSELRARTDDKIRLYQNFKCLECNFLFSFYEDYCEHVDKKHVSNEQASHVCVCMEQFDNPDSFRQHIHKSCYLNYYCDVCCLLTPSLEEFTQHCEESHDHEEDYTFLTINPKFTILNNIEIANILLDSKESAKAKEEEKARKIEERKIEKGIEFVPILEPADETLAKPVKVLNPAALFSNKNQRDCGLCGKSYSNYHNMIRHLKTFHGIDPNNVKAGNPVCDVCGNEFSSYHNMLRHRKIHESQLSVSSDQEDTKPEIQLIKQSPKIARSSFRCEECGECFKNANKLAEHEMNEHTFTCTKCGKEFNNSEDLEQHRSVHLNITLTRDPNTKNYHNASKMCQICDKSFPNDSELEEHLLLHEKMPTLDIENEDHKEFKEYKCEAHNKTYRSSRGLWGHNKKFHPEKMSREDFPKQCDHCDRVLSTMSGWVMHKQMHHRVSKQQIVAKTSNENEDDSDYHTCRKCFKVFGNKYNLMKHLKCHGIHTGGARTSMKSGKSGKTFWCDICHQGCPGLEELKKHKLEHKNEESDIDVQTDNKKKLITQIKTEPVKQVYCKFCKIPFNTVVALNEHMSNEHDEKKNAKQAANAKNKFSCELCAKVFASSSALCSHQGWHKRGKVDRVFKLQTKMFKKFVQKDVQPKPNPKFKCPTCGQLFHDDTSLQLHVLEIHRNIATTILTTKCSICNLEFTSQSEYEAHERMHHKPKDNKTGVTCKFCQRVFSRSDYLNLHINKKHPEMLGSSLFKCNICERVFDKQKAFNIHLQVHQRVSGGNTANNTSISVPNNQTAKTNGVRVFKYSCSICHIGFDIPKELRNHIISSHPF